MMLQGALPAWVAVALSPSPSPGEQAPLDASPGLPGFLALFALAVVIVLLAVDMTKRIRGLRYRAEVAQRRPSERQDATDPGSDTDSADLDGGHSDKG